VCGEYADKVWVERISDKDQSVEISGHEGCINMIHKKVKGIKDLDKKSVDKVLKEINLIKLLVQ
jgi:hypothetical protein